MASDGAAADRSMLLLRGGEELAREDVPVAQSAPSSPQRASQPTVTPQPERQVPRNGSPAAQPQVQESPAKDIPLALATSVLARPIVQELAERVSKNPKFPQLRLMSMEDTEALRALCSNTEFAFVSRRISDAELAQCRKWGIDLAEWKIGHQAIVLAAAPTTELPALSPRDIFLALARRVPDPAEPWRLIDNPHQTWHDVDARFDYRNIDVLIPPDATTRAVFLQLVMEAGCDTFPWIRGLKGLDWPRYRGICHQLRSDDRLREVELSNTLVTQKLWAEPNWLVVLGYSYYASYRTELNTMLKGVPPTLATLTDGTYTAARPVYVYGQTRQWSNHAARVLGSELTSEQAVGSSGYLTRLGLVPLDEPERRKQREEFSR